MGPTGTGMRPRPSRGESSGARRSPSGARARGRPTGRGPEATSSRTLPMNARPRGHRYSSRALLSRDAVVRRCGKASASKATALAAPAALQRWEPTCRVASSRRSRGGVRGHTVRLARLFRQPAVCSVRWRPGRIPRRPSHRHEAAGQHARRQGGTGLPVRRVSLASLSRRAPVRRRRAPVR